MDTLTQNRPAPCKTRPYYESGENADAYEVRVFMPGVKKEGLGISLNGDELSITGKREGAVPAGWRAIRREVSDADYELVLGLNVEVDGAKIAAKLEDGVLLITLPKAEKAKPRTISIE